MYHMFFGLCGLSLIRHMEKIGSRGGGTVFALPTGVVWKLGLHAQVISNTNGDMDDQLGMHSTLKQDKVKP